MWFECFKTSTETNRWPQCPPKMHISLLMIFRMSFTNLRLHSEIHEPFMHNLGPFCDVELKGYNSRKLLEGMLWKNGIIFAYSEMLNCKNIIKKAVRSYS